MYAPSRSMRGRTGVTSGNPATLRMSIGFPLHFSAASISAVVAVGLAFFNTANAPDTCGAAIEVPDFEQCGPSVVMQIAPAGTAARMAVPGAIRSTSDE